MCCLQQSLEVPASFQYICHQSQYNFICPDIGRGRCDTVEDVILRRSKCNGPDSAHCFASQQLQSQNSRDIKSASSQSYTMAMHWIVASRWILGSLIYKCTIAAGDNRKETQPYRVIIVEITARDESCSCIMFAEFG